MPLQTSEKAALDQAAAVIAQASTDLSTLVAALVADPVPNPLQVALDAMTAERDSLAQSLQTATADLLSVVDQRNALQGKIDTAKAHIQTANAADAAEDAADATGDASRAAALQALE